MTLLQRLASVGFGTRKHDGGVPSSIPAMPPEVAPLPVTPAAPEPVQRPAMSPVHAEYAKRSATSQGYRPAQGSLDPQGRIATPPRSAEDDQLEIPAFLRRQSN